jgi:hypothetical protein
VDEETREPQGTPLALFQPVVPNGAGQFGEAGQQREKVRTALVTVLYSIVGDVYKVPSANADLWLSVQVDAEPHPGAAVQTADGRGWRRAYCAVHLIYAGQSVALPADDPLVVDYLRQVKAEPPITEPLSPASRQKAA